MAVVLNSISIQFARFCQQGVRMAMQWAILTLTYFRIIGLEFGLCQVSVLKKQELDMLSFTRLE
eukprot:172497-Amphidinium_carterae.1